jgi:hypothetical protein
MPGFRRVAPSHRDCRGLEVEQAAIAAKGLRPCHQLAKDKSCELGVDDDGDVRLIVEA